MEGYKYIDEIHELKIGRYLKWKKGTKWNGGFIVKVNIESNGTIIICKKGIYFVSVRMDEHELYQKLSLDEQLIKKIEELF
jgi:hypothetical protein